MEYPIAHKSVAISGTTSADLLAAVTNADTFKRKAFRVTGYHFSPAGTVTIKFQSGGSTDLTGAMSCIAGTPHYAYNPHGLFQTAVGEKLNYVLSGSTAVAGVLTYQEIGNDNG